MWRTKAKEGFSELLDRLADDYQDTLHVRLRVDGEHVQLHEIDQRREALATLERLTGARMVEKLDEPEPLFQVVIVATDGTEEISERACCEAEANAIVESFNFVGPPDGSVAEARPCFSILARDASGKIRSLLCA